MAAKREALPKVCPHCDDVNTDRLYDHFYRVHYQQYRAERIEQESQLSAAQKEQLKNQKPFTKSPKLSDASLLSIHRKVDDDIKQKFDEISKHAQKEAYDFLNSARLIPEEMIEESCEGNSEGVRFVKRFLKRIGCKVVADKGATSRKAQATKRGGKPEEGKEKDAGSERQGRKRKASGEGGERSKARKPMTCAAPAEHLEEEDEDDQDEASDVREMDAANDSHSVEVVSDGDGTDTTPPGVESADQALMSLTHGTENTRDEDTECTGDEETQDDNATEVTREKEERMCREQLPGTSSGAGSRGPSRVTLARRVAVARRGAVARRVHVASAVLVASGAAVTGTPTGEAPTEESTVTSGTVGVTETSDSNAESENEGAEGPLSIMPTASMIQDIYFGTNSAYVIPKKTNFSKDSQPTRVRNFETTRYVRYNEEKSALLKDFRTYLAERKQTNSKQMRNQIMGDLTRILGYACLLRYKVNPPILDLDAILDLWPEICAFLKLQKGVMAANTHYNLHKRIKLFIAFVRSRKAQGQLRLSKEQKKRLKEMAEDVEVVACEAAGKIQLEKRTRQFEISLGNKLPSPSEVVSVFKLPAVETKLKSILKGEMPENKAEFNGNYQFLLRYIAAYLCLDNAQRPSVMANMTVYEFQQRRVLRLEDTKYYVIYVQEHKTGNQQPANVALTSRAIAIFHKFLEYRLRLHGSFSRPTSNAESPLMFVQLNNHKISMVSKLVQEFQVTHKSESAFTSTVARKVYSTAIHSSAEDTATHQHVTKYLAHSYATSKKHYVHIEPIVVLKAKKAIDDLKKTDIAMPNITTEIQATLDSEYGPGAGEVDETTQQEVPADTTQVTTAPDQAEEAGRPPAAEAGSTAHQDAISGANDAVTNGPTVAQVFSENPVSLHGAGPSVTSLKRQFQRLQTAQARSFVDKWKTEQRAKRRKHLLMLTKLKAATMGPTAYVDFKPRLAEYVASLKRDYEKDRCTKPNKQGAGQQEEQSGQGHDTGSPGSYNAIEIVEDREEEEVEEQQPGGMEEDDATDATEEVSRSITNPPLDDEVNRRHQDSDSEEEEDEEEDVTELEQDDKEEDDATEVLEDGEVPQSFLNQESDDEAIRRHQDSESQEEKEEEEEEEEDDDDDEEEEEEKEEEEEEAMELAQDDKGEDDATSRETGEQSNQSRAHPRDSEKDDAEEAPSDSAPGSNGSHSPPAREEDETSSTGESNLHAALSCVSSSCVSTNSSSSSSEAEDAPPKELAPRHNAEDEAESTSTTSNSCRQGHVPSEDRESEPSDPHTEPADRAAPPSRDDLLHRHLNNDFPWLSVQSFGNRGRGVVVTRKIRKGTVLCTYKGKRITQDYYDSLIFAESDDEKEFASYAVEYKDRFDKDQHYFIDAREDDGSFGRLCNHTSLDSHATAELSLKKFSKNTKSRTRYEYGQLVLIAKRDLDPGEEVLWNYGPHYEPQDWMSRCVCVKYCGGGAGKDISSRLKKIQEEERKRQAQKTKAEAAKLTPKPFQNLPTRTRNRMSQAQVLD